MRACNEFRRDLTKMFHGNIFIEILKTFFRDRAKLSMPKWAAKLGLAYST
jgi:hypothetical protein